MQRIEQLGGIFGGARSIVGLAAVSLILAACSTAASSSASASASATASASAARRRLPPPRPRRRRHPGRRLSDQRRRLVARPGPDGPDGRTIYRFTPDSANTSTCTGGCARPAGLTAASAPTAGSGVTGQVATMTRDDDWTQVTVNGFPRHLLRRRHGGGQVNGQGIGGKWS